MTGPFRLYGAQLSPFAAKVRNYLQFKGLEFEWRERTQARQEEFARFAKLPLAPVLVDANGVALQDSTPTIEALEAEYPEPSAIPGDPALAFLSALLEDYADEWLSKAMYHYRWSYPEDQASAAKRLVDALFEGAAPDGVEDVVRARMVGRLHHVGSTTQSTPAIEASFTRLIALLDQMLAGRTYLFGERPCFADFGLAAQIKQALADPTPGALIRAQAPRVAAWAERMESARVQGSLESLDALKESLAPLLREELAGAYLIWASANAQAVADDAPGVAVELSGAPFVLKPQRYAAKAFAELCRKRARVDDAGLTALLEQTGCDAFLRGDSAMASSAAEEDDGEDGEDDEA